MKFHLLFSYEGSNFFTPGNNDGAVSIASQLAAEMQERADTIFGFNEDHVSILVSKVVSEKLNALLEDASKY